MLKEEIRVQMKAQERYRIIKVRKFYKWVEEKEWYYVAPRKYRKVLRSLKKEIKEKKSYIRSVEKWFKYI